MDQSSFLRMNDGSRIVFLVKTLQAILKRRLSEIFEIYSQDSNFRLMERTFSMSAFFRVSKFASLCDRLWERQGSQSSLTTKRAFRRWMVRTNFDFGQECIDRILASCRKTPKNVGMMLKIIVRKRVTLKKKKFLQFVSFLVTKLEHSRDKILHNNKNFFFFSVCLIAGKKKNEELSRIHNSFVHLLNFKLGQNTGDILDSVLKNSPKALLLHSLARASKKKLFDALQSVRVFTKKTNFITAFKFLDLVQSKILANCRAVIEDNVSLKRRFIELAVGKVKSGLRRFLKQLSNRSMMLRNKRSGMERFANLIENGISTAKMRKAWGNILKVYKVKLNLNRLEQKFPLFDKLYTSGLKSSVLETLRNYSSKIQENTKLALVKNLVARQNRKRKIALEALARFNSGFKGAVKFIFKQLKRSEEFKRSAAFERLVLNRFSAEFSDRNVQGVGAKIALTERLMLVAKMKKMIALGAMQRIASQAKKQSELLGRRMVQKIKETYRTALDQLRDNARRLANKEQRTKSLFKKLLGQKYKEALRFGLKGLRDWHGVENKLKSLANCLISVQNRSKNRALKESLQILRHERLTGKMADLQTQKAADKKAFVLKELAKKLKLKTVEALFRLRKLNDKQKQLLKGLFGRFVKNMNFTAMFFLKRLQKNRDLFIYSSDQEKRKIRNFRIANALLRIGDVPKKRFMEALKSVAEDRNRRDFVLKRTFQKMYRNWLGNSLSKLISCVRNEKMQEIDMILTKTRNDLSQIHKEVLPQFNKMLIRNVFVGAPTRMFRSNARTVLNVLRGLVREKKTEAIKMRKLMSIMNRKLLRSTLLELQTNRKERSQFQERATYNAYRIEVLIRSIRKANKKAGIDAISAEAKDKKRFNKLVKGFVDKIRETRMRPALSNLKSNAVNRIREKRKLQESSVQQGALSKLRDLEKAKKLQSFLVFLNLSKQAKKQKELLAKTLKRAEQKHLAKVISEFKENKKEAKLGETAKVKNDKLKNKVARQLAQNLVDKERQTLGVLRKVLRSQNNESRLQNFVFKFFVQRKQSVLRPLKALTIFKSKFYTKRILLKGALSKIVQKVRTKLRNVLQKLRKTKKSIKNAARLLYVKATENATKNKKLALAKLLPLSTIRLSKTHLPIRLILSANEKLKKVVIAKLKGAFDKINRSKRGVNPKMLLQSVFNQSDKRQKQEALGQLRNFKNLVKKGLKQLQKLATKTVQKMRLGLFSLKLNVKQKRDLADKHLRVITKVGGAAVRRYKDIALKKLKANVKLALKKSQTLQKLSRVSSLKTVSTFASLRDFFQEKQNKAVKMTNFLANLFTKKNKLLKKETLLILRGTQNKRKFQAILNSFHHLNQKSTRKVASAFSRLKNPTFKRQQIERGLYHLSNRVAISQFDQKNKALLRLKRLSAISQLKTFKNMMVLLTRIVQKSLLFGLLSIQSTAYNPRRLRVMRPEKLAAIRYVKNSINVKNSLDPYQLLYPSLLKLMTLLPKFKTSPAQELTLQKFQSVLVPKRPEDYQEKSKKLVETRLENLEYKSKNTAIAFGNELLLEKNKMLINENETLVKEAENLKNEKENLSKAIKGLQKETDTYEKEVEMLQDECEKLKSEREMLANEQKMIEERLLAMDPHFDLNASKMRASAMFNSVDNLQASQLLLSKAARERKDLEAIVAKYQEETRILEEEIVKLEDEELEIIAKMMAIKEEKAKLEQKLGEKDAILAGILAENDALRSEMAHSMKLLDEAKKAQASLLESVPVAAVSPKELEEKTKEFEVARVNMANQLNTKRVQIDKHENKIQQLEQLISNVVPANTTVDQHIDQLTTEIKAIESQNLTISGAKNILFEKIKAAKKELTNLLADKGYLINQKNNHLDNKAKYEKEMSVATSPKEKQLIQEKISQMLMNLKVIEDNIVVNEKNLAQEADKVAKFEQQIQAYDKESSANDAAIEARKAEIKEIGSSNKALVQLKKEKEDLEKERELGQTNLRILEQNFNAFKTKAEQSQKLPPEVDKALSKNRQQISRLEGLILNNRHKLEANEKKSKEVATEAEQLKQLLGQKEQKVHEIDQKMGGIAQKKTEARHKIEDLKMNPPQSIAHNLPDLRDHINLDESMGPERKELKSILKKSSHEIVDMSPLAAQKLYPPSEFVPNDYTQVLASETAPVTRRKLTSRLFEIRANLKEYGKDIETKDENIKSLKEKLLGNREVITNFHNILGQKSELVEHVENRITRNVSIIQENKKLFAENAQKIQQNREAIEKNYQEIKDINSEFKRFTTVVAAEPFAFDGRAKDMVSKKIQTSVNQVSESRCQTDLDSGDIENLEKRAKQKHIIKINESAAAVAARKNSRMEQGIGVDEPFAPRKSKDVVNFAQTQTTNTSFKITRDAEVGENKLFGEAKIGTEEPLKEKIELDEKKQRGDFGKKPFVEQAVSADLLSPRASGGQKRELESPATAPLVYTRYPAVLKKDKKDSIGFIKRNPPIDPEIFPEIEMIGSNRLKHLVRAEPKKPPKTYSENMVVDFNTSSPNPEEQARDNMEEMSFGNFETERASIVKARTQKVLEIDNIFEFLIPRSGPQDASPLVSQSQKFYTKFADHSRTTNVKKLSKLLAMEALIRGKGNYQVSMALIDIVNAAKAQKRAEDRKNFEIARSVSINNKKARVPFQLKALKEDKLRKNKTFCNTMYHVFREHLKTYFFNLAEGIALTSTKVELQAEHKKELAIATNYHVAKMTSIRKAKGTFDGFLSRTIFRRLNQAFHRIFDFAQKRNQNFFKKFVPVMVRADENMKNLLMDVLQYWYNVRGESNWTQRIFRHFIFKASLTNQIAALRLKMYKKKPSKKGSAMREFAQKLSVVLSKQSHRLLADGFKLVEQVKRLRPKKEASFILSQASAEIEGLKGPDDDSERDEILKRYELMLSQQEMRAINLNMKIINGRVCEALRRQAGFAFRNILYSKRR